MVALEDGKVSPTDVVDCKDGTWQFNEKVKITDHNTGEKANGIIPVSQAIVRSSNVGMAKVIYNAYKDDPQEFVNHLRAMGVGMPMDIGFPGAARAEIRGPRENSQWAPSDLASMAYGYSVHMPLLYTLAFYNAIANNGQMMQPYYVQKIVRNGEVIKECNPVVLKKSICSEKTLKMIKDMMLQVVEDSVYGTGKPVRSKFVRIAGKTGTARYDYRQDEEMKHQVSFCGFYPFENPQYTCIVFIRNPRNGSPGGGSMAGPVFKEIAERVMAVHTLTPITNYKVKTSENRLPAIKNGNFEATRIVMSDLQFWSPDKKVDNPWVKFQNDSTQQMQLLPLTLLNSRVPDVKGMGIKDAIYILEKLGLKVIFSGRGSVTEQSLSPGTVISKNEVIRLSLK
jgi:cell division protein FtsI (penicillin-binding protein 3)